MPKQPLDSNSQVLVVACISLPPCFLWSLQLIYIVVQCKGSHNYLWLLYFQIVSYALQHLPLTFCGLKCPFYNVTQLGMVAVEHLLRITRRPILELLHVAPLSWMWRHISWAKCIPEVHQIIVSCTPTYKHTWSQTLVMELKTSTPSIEQGRHVS
jgi:hypothetical protein